MTAVHEAQATPEMDSPKGLGSAILVVGMHRSGTSAVAGVLNYLGFSVPGELVPPAFDNPKGFFENRRFVEFDDELLAELGMAYDDAVSMEGLDVASVSDAPFQLDRLIEQELGAHADVIVKDPRICRLLPFWIPALERSGRRVVTIHPLRDPLQVARSLQKRNEFPLEQGLLLWLSHVVAAEKDSRSRPRSFLMFDGIMRDWKGAAEKIAREIDVSWPRSFEEAGADIEGFLSDDLRHHRSPRDASLVGNSLGALVQRAWSALLVLIEDPNDSDAMARLDAVSASLSESEALYRGFVTETNRLLLKRYDRIDALEQHAGHMNHVVTQLNHTIKQEGVAKDHWRRTAETLEQEGVRLRVQIDGLEMETRRLIGDRNHLEELRRLTQHQLETVLSSFSWRAGAPLRRISRRIPDHLRARLRAWARAMYRWLRHTQDARIRPASAPTASDPASDTPSVQPAMARRHDEHARQGEILLRSPYFDPAFYASEAGIEANGLDAAIHYLTIGEAAGLRPSPLFDPTFYTLLYPELPAAVPNLLIHYSMHGAAEGRAALSATARMNFPDATFDPDRKTVLVIGHEASRTGAPILAWNIAKQFRRTHNVVTLLMAGGEFEPAFAEAADVALGPVGRPAAFDPREADMVSSEIVKRYAIDFAVANSVETRNFAVSLEKKGVPVIALVHEFSTYYRPLGLLHDLYEKASRIVFPAKVVYDVSRLEYEAIRKRACDVVPQGPSIVPKLLGEHETDRESDDARLLATLRPEGFEDAFLVLGMGTVQQRKGVDLFVAAALAARQNAPDTKFRFLWIGHGYKPKEDLNYSVYLQAQIELSGIGDCLEIIENVADLEPVYERMDALLLSSRLDPLPNVSIDAALRGIPVVCFDGATGMSDILVESPETRRLVVPHLDAHLAGREIAALATDKDHRVRVSQELRAIARRTFDMDAYVARLAAIGDEAMDAARRMQDDAEAIAADPSLFDEAFYAGEVLPRATREQALDHYLQAARRRIPGAALLPYAYPRRPLPGFNPLRFEAERPDVLGGLDALVAFGAEGRPKGPWAHEVIHASDGEVPPPTTLKIALHGHFHYPELLPEFLERLAANRLACDLFLTTDSDAAVERLRHDSAGFSKGRVDIRKVPNRGRDIAPFLTVLGRETLEAYDIVGHLHGKRSLHTAGVDPTYGERWRTFLWEHLLGDRHPMADRIASAFETSRDLGLVFPEDPNLVGWDDSRARAEEIAARMGLPLPLPYAFDFPNGTMFWARPAALAPLFDLGLTTGDYPAEPLANDGTLLHALERLLPFAVERAGYRIATTLVPGVVR